MIRHLSKREKWIALLTAAALIASVSDRVVIRPLMKQFADRVQFVETRQSELVKHMALLERAQDVERRHRNLSEVFGWETAPQAESAGILEEVEKIGQVSGIKILDIKPLTARDGGFYRSFRVELECEGTIEHIAQFLLRIGEPEKGMGVENMRLTARRAGGEDLRANMRIARTRLISAQEM